jgi:SAM-dependent methyltransferase
MLVDTHKAISDRVFVVEGTCPACGTDKVESVGHKNGYAFSKCAECHVVFTTVRDHGEAVADLYDHYYDNARFAPPPVVEASLDRLVRSFGPFRNTNRWLDIGYGEGVLLGIAEGRGWDCSGTEISPQAIEYGQQRGWIVTSNVEDDPRFPASGFDVVTMIELLEHVAKPHDIFQAAARWLRPGGLLYITTPNANSLNRRLLGLEWTIFSPPEHVTIWTACGLRHALRNVGFEIGRIRTEGLNPCEIIARLRRGNNSSQPVDRNTTAFALNSAFSSSSFRRGVKKSINRCLSAFQAGDTLKVWAVRTRQ